MEAMEETLVKRNLEYIKIEWTDIHHSRQQEWGAIVVIAGIFYAIAKVDPAYPGGPLEAKAFLGLLGTLSAFLGALICWQHHIILQDKISVIVRLERQIGINYPVRYAMFPVQILLFLMFGGICSTFVGLTLGFVAESWGCAPPVNWAYSVGLVVFVGFVIFAYWYRRRALDPQPYGYKHPFHAETKVLKKCVGLLGDVPLKIVAEDLFSRPGIQEESWEEKEAEWSYEEENGLIVKPILLNRRDTFQFSLANASSKQDWHRHQNTFELYVSSGRMMLEYPVEPEGKKKTRQIDLEKMEKKQIVVNRGVLIVPPGIWHKIELSATTFVFQATQSGRSVSSDKEIPSSSAA